MAVPAITLSPIPAITKRSTCQPNNLIGDLIGIVRLLPLDFLRGLNSVLLSERCSGRASTKP